MPIDIRLFLVNRFNVLAQVVGGIGLALSRACSYEAECGSAPKFCGKCETNIK